MKRWVIFGIAVVAMVAGDQWIKLLVEARLPFQEAVDLLPFLSLYRTWNQGIAFSMLWGLNDAALVALTLAITGFVLFLASRTAQEKLAAWAGFAMIVGGAMGNMIDRAIHGHVIDYVLFHTPQWSFAVFNLADAFISVGAALVILQEFLDWRAERHGHEPKPD
jgi:signal peptidase II